MKECIASNRLLYTHSMFIMSVMASVAVPDGSAFLRQTWGYC